MIAVSVAFDKIPVAVVVVVVVVIVVILAIPSQRHVNSVQALRLPLHKHKLRDSCTKNISQETVFIPL